MAEFATEFVYMGMEINPQKNVTDSNNLSSPIPQENRRLGNTGQP